MVLKRLTAVADDDEHGADFRTFVQPSSGFLPIHAGLRSGTHLRRLNKYRFVELHRKKKQEMIKNLYEGIVYKI